MARIYQSRNLLDPSLLSIAEQKKQQYIQNNRDYLNKQTEAINTALQGIGQAATDWYGRSSRRNMLEDSFNKSIRDKLEIPEGTSPEEVAKLEKINAWVDKKNDSLTRSWNDPDYVAAREKFIQTGDPSSMNAYKQNVLMQQARAQDAFRKAQEAKQAKALHDEVAMRTARPDYMKVVDKYIDPNTSEGEKEILKEQLNAYKTKYPGIETGIDVEALREAKYADAIDKRTLELAQAQKEKDLLANRMNIENNVIPNINTKGELGPDGKVLTPDEKKLNYKKLITSMYNNGRLTKDDYDALYKQIEGTPTQSELTKKSISNAVAGAAGEQTKKNIQDTQDKNEAQGYVGQKMNSLQFNHLPENVKKHLTRDGQGVVKMR